MSLDEFRFSPEFSDFALWSRFRGDVLPKFVADALLPSLLGAEAQGGLKVCAKKNKSAGECYGYRRKS